MPALLHKWLRVYNNLIAYFSLFHLGEIFLYLTLTPRAPPRLATGVGEDTGIGNRTQ
jgi:hypothetical protein